ncbi:HNH endonuclease [Mycobacteroides abscessus]|uniref:HNH endonuclease n=1 Tax=Mycobacteroides abscessus TaxID=36809 RepID=UPI0018E4B9E0|nr:HNH endonuclease [Mycobacteroides abscessus]
MIADMRKRRGVRQSSFNRSGKNSSGGRKRLRTNESTVPEWRKIMHRVLYKAGNECQARDENGERFWGCEIEATQVHHIIAQIDGGTDDESNLIAVCDPCHERFSQATKAARAKLRKCLEEEARRKNHPGRKDRYE